MDDILIAIRETATNDLLVSRVVTHKADIDEITRLSLDEVKSAFGISPEKTTVSVVDNWNRFERVT